MQYSVHACARACSYCRFFMIASTRCICAAMSCRSWNHISLHTHTQNIYTHKVLHTHTQKSELGRSLVRKSVSRTFAPLYTRSLACHQCCNVLQCVAVRCSVLQCGRALLLAVCLPNDAPVSFVKANPVLCQNRNLVVYLARPLSPSTYLYVTPTLSTCMSRPPCNPTLS